MPTKLKISVPEGAIGVKIYVGIDYGPPIGIFGIPLTAEQAARSPVPPPPTLVKTIRFKRFRPAAGLLTKNRRSD